MNNNQTENIKDELKRIAAKQTLGLPLSDRDNAILTLYGNTDAAPTDINVDDLVRKINAALAAAVGIASRQHLCRGFHPDENGNATIVVDGNKINGYWLYGYFAKYHDDACIITNNTEFFVIPATVGEYTGLPDKNRKDIYEGDIVKIDGKYIRYVVYSNEHTAFCAMRYVDKQQSELTGTLGDGYDNYKRQYEVVGNIYETPELLEVPF